MPSKKNQPYNPKHAADETVKVIPLACADENEARKFLEAQRWGDCPCCPKCGSVNVYTQKGRDGAREVNGRWRCRDCSVLYTVRTGTVMEDSRVPLRHWAYAFWRMATSKKGVAALEVRRQTGLSYKTSLFLLHRVRFACAPAGDTRPLKGIVEADETLVGGKPRYPQSKIIGGKIVASTKPTKTQKQRLTRVFAAVERGGQMRARVIAGVTSHNLSAAVRGFVSPQARLITDECPGYMRVGKEQAKHDTIRHKNRIYVQGDITTNTVESFFALLKRGIHGIYHHVSREHLSGYLAEFQYRYDNRHLSDGERTVKLIQRSARGKKLLYRDHVVRRTKAA